MRTFCLVPLLAVLLVGASAPVGHPAQEVRVRDGKEPDRKTLGCGRFSDEELAKEKYRKVTFFVSKIMFDGTVVE